MRNLTTILTIILIAFTFTVSAQTKKGMHYYNDHFYGNVDVRSIHNDHFGLKDHKLDEAIQERIEFNSDLINEMTPMDRQIFLARIKLDAIHTLNPIPYTSYHISIHIIKCNQDVFNVTSNF